MHKFRFISCLIFLQLLGLQAYAAPITTILPHLPLEAIVPGDKIALYRGSFDPLHVGHEAVITDCLKHGFKAVILFPAFGMGEKVRTSLAIRTEMLNHFAANHRGVYVLNFSIDPQEESSPKVLSAVRVDINDMITSLHSKGANVFKVIGSDVVHKELAELTTRTHIWNGYVIMERKGFPITDQDITRLKKHGFQTLVVKSVYADLSSTQIRTKVKNHEDISALVSPATAAIIKQYQLYQ